MPTYDYLCEKCGYESTEILKIADRHVPCEVPCEKCGEEGGVILKLAAPFVGDPIAFGVKKPPREFQEVMGAISKAYPRNNMEKFK